MDKFTIKDIEKLSGIKAHTIRIWEQRYCFLKPCRTSSNIRYYSCEELKTILNIAFLNKQGFKISHIEKMCAEEINEKVLKLEEKIFFSEKTINVLLQQMIDLNVEKFENIVNDEFENRGIDNTVMHVIFPFLERTNILHLPGFDSAREQLISILIRQKLLMAIDNLIMSRTPGKTAILFSPIAVHQELGLLSLLYLLKRNEIETIYLGAGVALRDAAQIASQKKCGVVLTQPFAKRTAKLINELHKHFRTLDLLIFDTGVIPGKLPSNVHIKTSLSEVNKFLTTL